MVAGSSPAEGFSFLLLATLFPFLFFFNRPCAPPKNIVHVFCFFFVFLFFCFFVVFLFFCFFVVFLFFCFFVFLFFCFFVFFFFVRREEERGKERKGKKIVHAGFFICKGERKDGKGGSGKKLPRGEEREDIRKQRGKNAMLIVRTRHMPQIKIKMHLFFFFFFFLVQCDFN